MLFRELVRIFGFLERKKDIERKFVIRNVPYCSQWESPNLVKGIINGKVSAQSDPLWRKSGAESKAEYEFWARNMCGMACLNMILGHKFGKSFPLIQLGKTCMKYGGYVPKSDTIDGLYYKQFADFIDKEFDLKSEVVGRLSLQRIVGEISGDNYVMASVSHKIRNPDSQPLDKGGHLVLILGYSLDENRLLLHNPSGDTPENQKYAEISFKKFNKFFAGRGIIIRN